ncbi:MAG: YicC family protein [Oscillospiraceae bacterium]|nr:YicC family protein [Oscillospiraceae bacterium]
MIKSMTGFGSAKGVCERLEISVELKSVNNRYLDCTVKLPRVFSLIEEPLKAIIQKHISRGKVDVYIAIDTSSSEDVEIKVNRHLAKAYVLALTSMAEDNGLRCDINVTDLTRFPDILQAEKREADPEILIEGIGGILKEAISGFDNMRLREGEKLKQDILARLTVIGKLTDLIEEISPRSVAEYRKKLEVRMSELLQTSGIDEERILMEAAIFADRVAINEETVRLRSHIGQLKELLDSKEPVGRKIDFLVQELNREANTIGSKGNDAEMSRNIVDLKAEIEKIREQAQNIE